MSKKISSTDHARGAIELAQQSIEVMRGAAESLGLAVSRFCEAALEVERRVDEAARALREDGAA